MRRADFIGIIGIITFIIAIALTYELFQANYMYTSVICGVFGFITFCFCIDIADDIQNSKNNDYIFYFSKRTKFAFFSSLTVALTSFFVFIGVILLIYNYYIIGACAFVNAILVFVLLVNEEDKYK